MSSIPKRFSIVINDKHVIQPTEEEDELCHAQVADKSSTKPAVFELEDDRLISGEWALGRHPATPHIIGYKPLVWVKKENNRTLHPVIVKEREEGPQLRFGDSSVDQTGRPLGLQVNKLFVSNFDDDDQDLTVELVATEE
ncbi:hypothetical protein FBEOM_14219 [Fusarium beomiforme]|uniref:Uncharacterized protein n=1 Tax=Fusarium beomiforme TaxID=44412 RepID=A0A9P5DM97_9HYPO|nr:hypothetical protein FBEOM_14219 [Fusarium beomiforme]